MLYLIRHAPTGQTQAGVLPTVSGADPGATGPGLAAAGREAARRLAGFLPTAAQVWASHARRAVETAEAACRAPDELTDALAEVDFGAWGGRSLGEVHAADPAGLARWMADPADGPPGGESFTSILRRADRVLARAAGVEGHVVAVTHGGFVRAAVAHVLGSPASTALALGIAAPSVTVLECADDGVHWQLRTVGWTPQLAGVAA